MVAGHRKGYIECTGRATSRLADKDVGDSVGFRGSERVSLVVAAVGSAVLSRFRGGGAILLRLLLHAHFHVAGGARA
jgi:hypothetical protein